MVCVCVYVQLPNDAFVCLVGVYFSAKDDISGYFRKNATSMFCSCCNSAPTHTQIYTYVHIYKISIYVSSCIWVRASLAKCEVNVDQNEMQ